MARKRSMLSIANDKPKRVVQVLAVDEFGELAERKRTATAAARKLGHQLSGFRRRRNDPAGRWDAFCADCNSGAVVCTEAPHGLPDVYGPAVMYDCPGRTR